MADLGASTFVPALVQINDQGATIRRVSDWSSFTDEQLELLSRFDRWRLVVRKGAESNGGTVEVAHEALFREWGRLEDWLKPERARLEALRALNLSAGAWERHDRKAAFLDHKDKRLSEAGALGLNENFRKRLGQLEFDYLDACGKAERVASGRARRMKALVRVFGLGIVAAAVGWLNELYLGERGNWFATMRPYMLTNVRPHVLKPEAERALKPQQTFMECAEDCPEMVVVPAGSFMMGSKDGVGSVDEHPQHKVTISKPFAVSKFDVTFDDWDACVAVGGCPQVSDSGVGRGRQPVINVSWHEAQQYVAWLSWMTGKPYRLLSEAEWEYAARAGSETAYSWGDEIGKGKANCDGCGSEWDDKRPAPVGSFEANAFGLHDMHGNVWQWCEDNPHNDYAGNPPTDGSVWQGGNPFSRVLRGGSWDVPPDVLRSANREWGQPDSRFSFIGFRVARTLSPQ